MVICTEVSDRRVEGDTPQATKRVEGRGEMNCKEEECDRKAHSRGWCTSHYRRHRTGQPMGDPIRAYSRRRRRTCRRVHPFAKELALLRELGLR